MEDLKHDHNRRSEREHKIDAEVEDLLGKDMDEEKF